MSSGSSGRSVAKPAPVLASICDLTRRIVGGCGRLCVVWWKGNVELREGILLLRR